MKNLSSVRKEPPIKILLQLILFTLILLFIFLPALAFSSEPPSSDPSSSLDEYLARTWTAEKGLPQNTINSLVQTSNGYIWIGTPTGLVRFDGVQFKLYTRENTHTLTNDRITSLFEDDSGVLWIGTDGGGLCSLTYSLPNLNYQWKLFSTQEGLSNNNIRAITSDWKGNLWVGTDYGLNRISQDGIRIYTTEDGLYDNIITTLALDGQGDLWVGSLQGGLARIKDYAVYTYGPRNGLLNTSILALDANRLGDIWIGTMEGLYYLGRNQQVLQYIPGTSYTPITSILMDSHGYLWIGTMADGLIRRRHTILSGFSLEKRFPAEYIHCILSDRAGNLWLGTDTEGLIELKAPPVKNITRSDGLPENTVLALIEDRTGTLWAGTRNSGLCRIKDNRVDKTINRTNGLSSNNVRCLYEDVQGNLWIGTLGGGINILKDGRIVSMNTEDGLKSNTVNAIIQDQTRAVWIATDRGLNRIIGDTIQAVETKDIPNLEGHSVKTLIRGKNNIIFIGTSKDLFSFQDGVFQEIGIGSGSPGLQIISLFEDSRGILWIGTKGRGLRCLSDGMVFSLSTKNGLIDDYIYGITEDDQGNLWMSTNRGIMRLRLSNFMDFFQEDINFIYPSFYDEADGLASRQGSDEGQPSLIKTASNMIFCATTKGIEVIHPENLSFKGQPPEVLIEDVKADSQSVPCEDGKIILSRRPALLEFQFTAIDFSAPDKIRFEYKLEGQDLQVRHTIPGEDRSASYINLPAGRFRFIVSAINNAGMRSDGVTAIDIEVKLPFYRTRAFYGGMFLFVLFLAAAGIVFRRQKKTRKLADKYKTSGIDSSRIDEILPKLLHLMEEDKLYLDPGLTLKDLAHKLRIHYNHLSRIINERFGLSYNDFVNKYRIAEAQRMLADPEKKEMNILEIIYEAGFYSKSVFNTAFKKFTGKTPSEYRKTQPKQ